MFIMPENLLSVNTFVGYQNLQEGRGDDQEQEIYEADAREVVPSLHSEPECGSSFGPLTVDDDRGKVWSFTQKSQKDVVQETKGHARATFLNQLDTPWGKYFD